MYLPGVRFAFPSIQQFKVIPLPSDLTVSSINWGRYGIRQLVKAELLDYCKPAIRKL